MALAWPLVRRRNFLDGRGQRAGRVATIHQHLVSFHLAFANPALQPGVARQSLPLAPVGLQFARRADRRPFVFGGHAKKILPANHSHIGNPANGRFIDGEQLRADRRRTDDPAVQHLRQHEILDVDMPSGAFGGHVGSKDRFADQCVMRGIFERRLGVHLQMKLPAVHQSAGRQSQQRLDRGRGRLTHFDTPASQTGASARRALIRRQRRVSFDQGDTVNGHAEFLGGHLAHGDAQARAKIDLAGIYGDRPIGMQREEAVDFLRIHRLPTGRVLSAAVWRKCEADYDRTARFQKIATGDHARLISAARITARTMRA